MQMSLATLLSPRPYLNTFSLFVYLFQDFVYMSSFYIDIILSYIKFLHVNDSSQL